VRTLCISKAVGYLDVAAAWLVVESMGVRRALLIECGLKNLNWDENTLIDPVPARRGYGASLPRSLTTRMQQNGLTAPQLAAL
jgi:predicted signal transduction protein with EAL and GGDEF domain